MYSEEEKYIKSIKGHSGNTETGTVIKYTESPDKVTLYKF